MDISSPSKQMRVTRVENERVLNAITLHSLMLFRQVTVVFTIVTLFRQGTQLVLTC